MPSAWMSRISKQSWLITTIPGRAESLSADWMRRFISKSSVILQTWASAVRYLDHNQAILAIVIPPDWTEKLKADRNSPLQIIIDGSDPNFAGSTRAYITAFISAL